MSASRADVTSEIGSRPLYAQVRERLLQRISSGTWRPGQLIPNEFELAREMGVSQGTARKALDSLAADGLLTLAGARVTVTEEGRPFVRLAAAVFDAYLEEGAARHSRAV